jgi:hypothetical protein
MALDQRYRMLREWRDAAHVPGLSANEEIRSMRKFLFCGLLFWLAVPMNADAATHRGGWCLVANLGIGAASEKCTFRSFEACQAEARSFGSTSFCRTSGYAPASKKRKYRY